MQQSSILKSRNSNVRSRSLAPGREFSLRLKDLFAKLKAWFAALPQQTEGENNPNAVITWLKHPGGGDTATITDLEAIVAITRAISKFTAVYSGVTQRMRGFLDWAAAQQKPTK
jgi:hypothetical protein